MTTLAITVVLATGIGVALGTLGGGGSILAVPLLVYIAGLPAHDGIATSLLVVGATSAVGLLPHARAGRVHWRTGLTFAAASILGAYSGGRLADLVPSPLLLTAFAATMLVTATTMIRGRRSANHVASVGIPSRARTLATGVAVGVITGLIGAGGGFLVVPALALLGGLQMSAAVGTSLLVIALNSLAGLAGHLTSVTINWPVAAAVTVAAIIGSLVGARLAGRIRDEVLRKTFGWFVVGIGTLVLAQQIPTRLWAQPILWIAVAIAAIAAGAVMVVRAVIPNDR